jgi:hypothetical protein
MENNDNSESSIGTASIKGDSRTVSLTNGTQREVTVVHFMLFPELDETDLFGTAAPDVPIVRAPCDK